MTFNNERVERKCRLVFHRARDHIGRRPRARDIVRVSTEANHLQASCESLIVGCLFADREPGEALRFRGRSSILFFSLTRGLPARARARHLPIEFGRSGSFGIRAEMFFPPDIAFP